MKRSSSGVFPFCLFILFMGFLRQEYWSDLPFLSLVNHILSELFTVTCPSWVALQVMAHSFIELLKLFHHSKAVIHEGVKFLQGWVISLADEWEEYSSYFGKEEEVSRHWTTVFWPLWSALELSYCLWVYHLACLCVTVSVYWGSRCSKSHLICHLGPSWF